MTTDIQKLDPDAAIDLAYDIFLEMAGENLDPADIMLFNLQFEDRGAVEFVETADDWEQEIGVLIDPDAFAEVHTEKKIVNSTLFGKNNHSSLYIN